MKKLKSMLLGMLLEKNQVVIPSVPTERMRITFMAQMTHGITFEDAFKAMIKSSPGNADAYSE